MANEPRFAETPPARIVPALADEGVYIASEASFHRVLRAHGQMSRRGRARPPHVAPARRARMWPPPRRGLVLGRDVPAGQMQGRWFYFYLILDLYSRKIVGYEVHETDRPSMRPTWPGERRSPRACMPRRAPGAARRQRRQRKGHDRAG